MPLTLPDSLEHALRPIFDALPPAEAMRTLMVDGAQPDPAMVKRVEQAVDHHTIREHPTIAAGLWLYVDALGPSHEVSQRIHTPTGSFWHGIMHRREGDFDNARHWLAKVGKHPVFSRIDIGGGGAGAGTTIGNYDPRALVDRVQRAYERGDGEHPQLVALQRHEWQALFEWCVEQP